MLHKHLPSDWMIDLPFSSITSACLFFPPNWLSMSWPWKPSWYPRTMRWPQNHPLASTLVAETWDNSSSLDQLWFLPLGSQVLSQSCFPWIGTYWGHLALPPRLMALTALVISPIFFSVLIAVWCWVAMTTDWLASNSWTGKHAAIKNYKWCLIVCCQ